MAAQNPVLSVGPIETITWTLGASDTGNLVNVEMLREMTVQNIGSGTATLQFSQDGTHWVTYGGSALTTNTLTAITEGTYLFAQVSAVSAAQVVILAGRRKFP
jgi:hypothetical protein